jgi:hypothetical protein
MMNFDKIQMLRRTGVRAHSICAVAAFLLFTICALSRVSFALSAVRLSNDGRHGRGRFLMPRGNCATCGVDFRMKPGRKYCSRACFMARNQVPGGVRCTRCGKIQSADFYDSRTLKSGTVSFYAACKACRSYAAREWQRNRPKLQYSYRRWLLKRYGLTPAAYESLLESQGGGCAICGSVESRTPQTTRMPVDHDHGTGAVRGILCGPCNRGLGFFGDDVNRLLQAVEYLRKSKS